MVEILPFWLISFGSFIGYWVFIKKGRGLLIIPIILFSILFWFFINTFFVSENIFRILGFGNYYLDIIEKKTDVCQRIYVLDGLGRRLYWRKHKAIDQTHEAVKLLPKIDIASMQLVHALDKNCPPRSKKNSSRHLKVSKKNTNVKDDSKGGLATTNGVAPNPTQPQKLPRIDLGSSDTSPVKKKPARPDSRTKTPKSAAETQQTPPRHNNQHRPEQTAAPYRDMTFKKSQGESTLRTSHKTNDRKVHIAHSCPCPSSSRF
jgi:hypothetical protein